MILDGHIHLGQGTEDPAVFHAALRKAGIAGGIVISPPPPCFTNLGPATSAARRLDLLFRWTRGRPNLFPFFWIDPVERDAADQVALALRRGVSGFKVICDHFYPRDPRAMKVFRKIAAAGRPILFHSGILWDGKPSGQFCRPVEFEALLDVDGLRFSLAHISWPWCDECIAVYGKFLNARSRYGRLSVEMFIDLTPGTPPSYRRDALTRLFSVGYDIERNLIFGTDCGANDYNHRWAREWVRRDNGIYRQLGLPKKTMSAICADNLRRFVGASHEAVGHRALNPAES